MADKTIPDLTLVSAVTDDANAPIHNGVQTYRSTAVQWHEYLVPKRNSMVATFTSDTTITTAHRVLYLDPTSGSFSQTLPACASLPVGFELTFKNIASNGNIATLDAASTELIDFEQTFPLNSDPYGEFCTIKNTGTKWIRIG